MAKKYFFLLLSAFFFSYPGFSREVYLTDAEFQTLLNIIKQSKTNSEKQTSLIAELKVELRAQETELKRALSELELSETALMELKSTLSRIRAYSTALSEYCETLERENKNLSRNNIFWKASFAGTSAAFVIVLLILLL